VPVAVLCNNFTKEHLEQYIAVDAATFLLTPLTEESCTQLWPVRHSVNN
jgi:hypothetical protein